MKINSKLIEPLIITTSGSPVKTGKKIDGKYEYVKRINYGVLPNSTHKDVKHGIVNGDIHRIDGRAKTLSAPHYFYSVPNNNMLIFYTNTYIRITTTTNESSYNAVIDLYFTYN